VITSEDIDTAYYASDFVVNEDTGGMEGGMAPGTVYLYTFSFCDGETTCVDADSDGYYAANDCDDTDPDVYTERTFYLDADGDGYGVYDLTTTSCSLNPPHGYTTLVGDCDPYDTSVRNPDTVYYADLDGDGYGDIANTITACRAPSEQYVRIYGDCDDTDSQKHISCADDVPSGFGGGILPTGSVYGPGKKEEIKRENHTFSSIQISAIANLLQTFGVSDEIVSRIVGILYDSGNGENHFSRYEDIFAKDLSKGMSDPDVKILQMLLNKDSRTRLAESGIGSQGEETDYFGALTHKAVVVFQTIYKNDILVPAGIKEATGYVGHFTREFLKKMLHVVF
jgi:hypothetical protein